jgi:FKBP-type peptidyl-prolyl cis-trans isomerase FkpA
MYGRRHFLWSTAVAVVAATAAGCSGDSDDTPTQPSTPPPTGPSTLQITDLTVGEGAEAVNGKTAFVTYALWRFDPNGGDLKGEALDANTFSWLIGGTSAIVGMSQGVQGMKVGGKRRLIIPPSLAYGSVGNGPIRPNEWIVFEIDLLAIA